jgi:hypothetical protein
MSFFISVDLRIFQNVAEKVKRWFQCVQRKDSRNIGYFQDVKQLASVLIEIRCVPPKVAQVDRLSRFRAAVVC